ncbi:hypothetical protein CTAYLR_005658 [Chrysophaeum taylorii]|uniref:Septin-type G domain-containing protein n=1 Tax=Chrysophaeum taylorii TaxID=2483200 RepID=A0AAD7UKS5_9STRA|nr:hypothetical protein CTAYLR_005658 [Chrysophaeum taylorii]
MLWLLVVASAIELPPLRAPTLKLKPRDLRFNVLVAGLKGLGKTTACRALLGTNASTATLDFATAVLTVSIVDSDLDLDFANFVAKRRHQNLKNTDSPDDCLIHVCVYFLSPHGLLDADRKNLRRIRREVTVIPVIAKADTLTDAELAAYRSRLEKEFAKLKIERPLAIISRDGDYRWGRSRIRHSDFNDLKRRLFSDDTEDLITKARSHFLRFKRRRLGRQKARSALKTIAILALLYNPLKLRLQLPLNF